MCYDCSCGWRAQDVPAAGPTGSAGISNGGRAFQHRTMDSTARKGGVGRREEESASRGSLGCTVTPRPGLLVTAPRPGCPGSAPGLVGSVADAGRKPALKGEGEAPQGAGLSQSPTAPFPSGVSAVSEVSRLDFSRCRLPPPGLLVQSWQEHQVRHCAGAEVALTALTYLLAAPAEPANSPLNQRARRIAPPISSPGS